jgi:hypothetical protein
MAMSDTALIRVCGICAIVGAAVAIAGGIVGGMCALGGQDLPLKDGRQLLSLSAKRSPYLTREVLFLLNPVFGLAEGFGLFLILRRAGTFVGWAAAAWFSGLTIGIVEDSLVVAVVGQLVPTYAAADAATRPALEAVAGTLDLAIRLMQLVANVLGIGVGMGLFAVAILRTSIAPVWLGWLGLSAVLLAGWFFGPLNLLAPRFRQLSEFSEFGFTLMVLWDVGMGIVLLRWQEPVVVASMP